MDARADENGELHPPLEIDDPERAARIERTKQWLREDAAAKVHWNKDDGDDEDDEDDEERTP